MPIDLLQDLPENVRRVLGDFLDSAHLALGASLKSVILFGSAAEGRLRATSDVNLLLVLDAFPEDAARQLQPQLEMAYAAIRLRVMLLLESELDSALEAFAKKFADIGRELAWAAAVFGLSVIPISVFPQRQKVFGKAAANGGTSNCSSCCSSCGSSSSSSSSDSGSSSSGGDSGGGSSCGGGGGCGGGCGGCGS